MIIWTMQQAVGGLLLGMAIAGYTLLVVLLLHETIWLARSYARDWRAAFERWVFWRRAWNLAARARRKR